MKVGRFYGIDVHIHWSFWMLILFYLVLVAKSGGLIEGLSAVLFVLAVFFCVLLHEYGHALAARYYGIRTHDITIMPIGGLARLERIPEKPIQELVVAIAGPLVNVAIAVFLMGLVALDVASDWAAPTVEVGNSFVGQLMAVNLFLVLFNMLPAFPMDGGRVVRSLLAMKFGFLRATEIAARLGRWMALAFAVWGIFVSWNPMLVLLAAFVFITGTMELFQVKLRSMQSQAAGQFGSGQWDAASWQQDHNQSSAEYPLKKDGDVIDAVDFRKIR
jgi:stage IV sporulation protein FB